MLLNENDYPLLWRRRMDGMLGEETDGAGNRNTPIPKDSQ